MWNLYLQAIFKSISEVSVYLIVAMVRYEISIIYIHPDYYEDHDIALLLLAEPSSKQPISVSSRELDDGLADGTDLIVTGCACHY
ncbi:hypothetical protein A3197_02695 [Candidatus Thiodiazotropha endoloripes]|nr:hypothetical protein A3197_02695 [Candidatus Thiodiazotropha endoloripes]